MTEFQFQLLVEQCKRAKLKAMCEHLNARLQRYEGQPSIKNYKGPTLVVSNEHVR